jgi:hypothetical protein
MIRKIVTSVEDIVVEGGRSVVPVYRVGVAAAVVSNPFADEFVEDISQLRKEYSHALAEDLTPRLLAALGYGRSEVDVACFGKAALVGTSGEIEHGSAILHNLDFGGTVRDIIGGGDAMIPSVEKRGGPGSSLDVPLKNRHDASLVAYHQAIEFRIADAPGPDEILIALALGLGPRPFARIGRTE